MTLPITRQGLEQIAIVLAVGFALFALLALLRRRRGLEWRRAVSSAGVLGAFAALALGLGYTVAPSIPTPPVPITARFAQPPIPDTGDVLGRGAATYQAKCAICHGPRGRGDGPAAAALLPRPVDLQRHVPQHFPGEVQYWIAEGVRGTPMPAWKNELSDTQIWEVVRFLYALAEGRVQ